MNNCFRTLLFVILVMTEMVPSKAADASSQQSALGLLDLAIKDRNALVDPAAGNALSVNAENWRIHRGGPRLDALGINLGPLTDKSSPLSWVLDALMVVMIRMAILRAMNEGANVAKVWANLMLKLLVGVLFVNFPQYVYGMGMVVRDGGVYLMRSAYSVAGASGVKPTTPVSSSPTNLDFELIRVSAIRRALKDHGQPIIGNASGLTYDLYDQLVQSTAGKASAKLSATPIGGQASQLEKTRMLTDRMPLLLEALSRLPQDTGAVNWVAKRVGKDGNVEVTVYGAGGSQDMTTADGVLQMQTGKFASSRINVTSPSLTQWMKQAEKVRSDFQTKADNGDFTSLDEMSEAEELAKTQYDALTYEKTSAFIRQTLWTEAAFGAGRTGGAVSDWQYPNDWSDADKSALNYWVDKLGMWYDTSTGRVGASYTKADPKDQETLGWSHNIVKAMGKMRDAIISRWGFLFFDIVIEAYVVIIFMAFPFWFYQRTAKAFTGALNTFIVACVTPAALSLIYLVWDALMTQALHLLTGGVFDLSYAWLMNSLS